MKWLTRILGKDEVPSTIAFDEIDTWLEMVSNSLFRGLNTTADQVYEELGAARERLKQDISKFHDAEPQENVPDNITKIGMLNHEKMARHLYSLTEKIVIPTQANYRTVLSFYRETTANLEFPFGKSSRTIYCVRSLFPDEIKEVISDLNQLRTLLNRLIAPIKGKEDQIRLLEDVPEIVTTIRNLKSELETDKKNADEREQKCSELTRTLETEEQQLKRLEEGDTWARYNELKTELYSLEKDLKALESDVNKLFSPLNKALNLLRKQDETGRHPLTPEERSAISSIITSPIRALNGDITGVLLTIKTIIESDPSILKDRKRDQTLKWIDHLLTVEFSSLKGRRDLLQSRIEEIKSTLSKSAILEERKEIEQSIISAKEQLTQLQEERARLKKHIRSLEEELGVKKSLLSESMEKIAEKKIALQFDF